MKIGINKNTIIFSSKSKLYSSFQVNQLVNYQKKFYYMYQDLASKNRALETPIAIPHKDYHDIYNEFLSEAEGVPYGSMKYIHLRNKYYKIIDKKYVEIMKNENTRLHQAVGTQEYFLKFYLIITPEEIENYKLLSLLNYNKMMYKVFEDCPKTKQILGGFLGYDYRKIYKNFNLPFLQMESSEENPIKVETFNEIINFLVENKFITEYRTYSAYEEGGLIFAEKFKEFFEKQFLKPGNKLSYYIKLYNFNECFYGYDASSGDKTYFRRMRNKILRALKYSFFDFPAYFREFIINRKNLT